MRHTRFGDWAVDLEVGEATRGDQSARLTSTECKLLAHLAASPGVVFSRRRLLIDVWAYHPLSRSRAVDTTVTRLRAKLEDDALEPRVLVTVRGEGYRFVASESPTEAPPPPDAPPSAASGVALPARADRFHGRAAELKALRALVDARERVVAILGPGGIGKTRLTEEFLRVHGDACFPRVVFVDAADARDADAVVEAIARSLSLRLGADPGDRIGRALHALGRALVVLDNLEQVAEAASALVRRWTAEAPDATFLLTSRVDLAIRGARVLALDVLERDDGVALFVDRARHARADDPEVERLVALLGGWPLALELAAARTRAMTIAQITARLSDQLRLLASARDDDRPARHATLSATLDWSWDLLAPGEREAVAQLSVFHGGFTLEAAEAILDLPDALWTLDALQALVDHAFLRFDPSRARYRMLVPVHAYAASRCPPELRTRFGDRHARYFAGLEADGAQQHFGGASGAEALALLGAEQANLERAREHATERGDHDAAAACAIALARVFQGSGQISAVLPHLAAALNGEPARAVELYCLRAAFFTDAGDLDAALADTDAALVRTADVDPRRGRALRVRSSVLWNLGQTEAALAATQAALDADHAAGNHRVEAANLRLLATRLRRMGRCDEARAACERAIASARAQRSRQAEAEALYALGETELNAGDIPRSRAALERARDLFADAGDRTTEQVVVAALGVVRFEEGDTPGALETLERALASLTEDERHAYVLLAHLYLARVSLCADELDASARHLDAVIAIADRADAPLPRAVSLSERARIALRSGRPDDATRHLDAAEPVVRASGYQAEIARMLTTRALWYAARGDHAAARPVLTEAEAIAAAVGFGTTRDFATRLAEARAALDDAPA